MDLPTDIWYKIINQSKMNKAEFIKNMTIDDLNDLDKIIKLQKENIYKQMKKNLNKYDVIAVYDLNDNYIMDCIILNLLTSKFIKICKLYIGNKKTIIGYYNTTDEFNKKIDLQNHKITFKYNISKIYNNNIVLAEESLKIGDVFAYSLLNSYEFFKYRKYWGNSTTSIINYGVVNYKTNKYIEIITNDANNKTCYRRINKNLILDKIDYHNDADIYINYTKRYNYMTCIYYIEKIFKLNTKYLFVKGAFSKYDSLLIWHFLLK